MSEFYIVSNELYHHGILGQKWGVRRYQNPDGSLTAAGRERYAKELTKSIRKQGRASVRNSEPYKIIDSKYRNGEPSEDYKKARNIANKIREYEKKANQADDGMLTVKDTKKVEKLFNELHDVHVKNLREDYKKDVDNFLKESGSNRDLGRSLSDYIVDTKLTDLLYEEGGSASIDPDFLFNHGTWRER